MSSKKVRDFVYHSAKFRGLPEYHSVALAVHLSKYLKPIDPPKEKEKS